jgi:type IV secretory pathway TraG/TraD family ATPase VirD4
MAEGGGTGITTMPVLQSLSQARSKWSDNAAGAIWDSSIVKIVLGGASNSRDLQDLSTLIGERDETTDSSTVGDRGSRSSQRSIRRVPIMPPDAIRTLPFGTALIILRAAPPLGRHRGPLCSRSDSVRPDPASMFLTTDRELDATGDVSPFHDHPVDLDRMWPETHPDLALFGTRICCCR